MAVVVYPLDALGRREERKVPRDDPSHLIQPDEEVEARHHDPRDEQQRRLSHPRDVLPSLTVAVLHRQRRERIRAPFLHLILHRVRHEQARTTEQSQLLHHQLVQHQPPGDENLKEQTEAVQHVVREHEQRATHGVDVVDHHRRARHHRGGDPRKPRRRHDL